MIRLKTEPVGKRMRINMSAGKIGRMNKIKPS